MQDKVRQKEESNTRRQADLLGLRYFDTSNLKQHPIFQGMLSTDQMYKFNAVILSENGSSLIVGLTHNTPKSATTEMEQQFENRSLNYVLISDAGYKEFMKLYDPPKEPDYQDIKLSSDSSSLTHQNVSDTLAEVHADDMFDYLLTQAKHQNASDIHLENGSDKVRIRFRVDGVLHEIASLDFEKFRQLMSTIATQGDVSTSSPDPPVGHIKHHPKANPEQELNIRIETIPTLHGQDAVLRVFNLDQKLLNLDNLGLSEPQAAAIKEVVAKPSGLVLAVGPTGSGKTTTLYSILNALNESSRKIVTLEDPIEYSLPGLVQIAVETSNSDSFAQKLKAVLRFDPDILMIGEIRDIDTARTALQAALSGHLVLSTFHANDAASALSRMMAMVGENPLFSSAIRMVIAQRLVRRLDEESKESHQPEDHLLNHLRTNLESLPESINKPNIDDAQFYQAVPSERSPFGFSGQTAVVEILKMTSGLSQLLRKSANELSTDDIHQQALMDGMVTIKQNAMLKALSGETSLEEAIRVTG